ncbi:MAG: hypothetical protein LWX83_04300 [Anaerolineae bacterium]|nr:hypothetical protein [Anaerolineae bacterium]
MEAFIRFLQNYEIWFYVLFGGVALIYLRKLILGIQEMRSTLFGLERDNAQRKISFSLSIVGILGAMMLAIFLMLSFVVPALPGLALLNTPTIDVLATATATLASDEQTAEPQTVVDSEGTPAPLQPTPTLSNEGCIPNQLEWVFPQPGEELSGLVTLKGTVNITNFGFYKYEIAQTGSDTWVTLAAGNTKVVNDTIGQWNTSQELPGDYNLRLVVLDNANNALPACVVPIKITQP